MSFILHFTEALLACVRTTKTRRLHVLFIDCLSRNLKGWVKRLRLLINTDPSQSNLPRFPNYTKQELTLQQQAHLVSNLTLILCREEVQVPICTEDRHKAKITQRDAGQAKMTFRVETVLQTIFWFAQAYVYLVFAEISR